MLPVMLDDEKIKLGDDVLALMYMRILSQLCWKKLERHVQYDLDSHFKR